MRACCMPSAECDDAHEAKQLFDVVGLLCGISFGIPLGLVLLRMVSGLSDSAGRGPTQAPNRSQSHCARFF